MLLLLFACTAPDDPPPTDSAGDTDRGDTGDTDGGDTDTGDTDSGDTDSGETDTGDTAPDTSAAGFACPADMVGVPTDSPAWCIDPYEATLADGRATAVAGVLPTVGVSFEEAAAACAATPATDASGAVYTMRRLATSAEWEDAGDGVVGEGGTRFPWGDTYDDTRCVTLSETGALQFDAMQPTGSMPGCVSVFGLFDQVGNAWEWTDSGVLLDADGALAALGSSGYTFVEDGAGLRLTSESVDGLFLRAAGVQPPTVSVSAEGYVEITAEQVQPDPESFFARGYLAGGPDAVLAVRIERTAGEDGAPWRLHVAREYDGRTLPDKRGCAWYTGGACAVSESYREHLPDFDGTIGFRCSAAPYPR